MMKNFQTNLSFKRFSLGLAIGSIAMLTQSAYAAIDANDTSTIPVDLAGINTTKHEIAVLQVLSEICPTMLNNQQKQKFYKTYNTELQKLMPTISDPRAAMQYLSTQQDYKNVLKSIRSWTLGISKEENKALCQDLAEASF